MSTYVVSDLHGQYKLFRSLLKDIDFSDEDKLYILGDVIDRGPDSIKLLKYIMNKKNITLLLGNHEHMMAAYLNNIYSDMGQNWLIGNNGGKETLKQFKELSDNLQKRITNYLNELHLQIEVIENDKKFLLSHSSFIIDKDTIKWKDINQKEITRTLWYSPWRFWEYESIEHYKRDDRIHIIGHVPVQMARYDNICTNDEEERFKKSNKLKELKETKYIINIDGGCAYIPFPEMDDFSNKGIICMNLTKYANKEKNAFIYKKY